MVSRENSEAAKSRIYPHAVCEIGQGDDALAVGLVRQILDCQVAAIVVLVYQAAPECLDLLVV